MGPISNHYVEHCSECPLMKPASFFPAPALALFILAIGLPLGSEARADENEGAHEVHSDPGSEAIPFAPPRLIPVDEEESDQGLYLDIGARQRLWTDTYERPAGEGRGGGFYNQTRLGAEIGYGSLRAVAETDLLTGRIAGSHPGTPFPAVTDHGARPFEAISLAPGDIADPRQAYLEWQSPVGMLRTGLQTSNWGLGLLANSGDDDDYFFGAPYGGDRSFRALFATAPLRALNTSGWWDQLFIAVGADLVYRDENADLRAGDQAYQFLGSILWDQEEASLGAYLANRNQVDRDDSTLKVTALDIFAERNWRNPGRTWAYRAAAEGIYLFGETTRADAPRAEGPIEVAAFGAAAHLEARHICTGIGVQLRSGFASGDANPRTPSLHRFRFDPNYRVGLLLFDHHIPAWTRHSVDGAEDELRLRDTPRGIDNLVESGSVTNALYVHPILQWDATEDLSFATGLLAAFSHRPYRDLLATFQAGGEAVGVNGAENPSNHLGLEAQFGVRYSSHLWDRLRIDYQGEGAFLLPGAAFDDPIGQADQPTGLLRAFVTASW